MWITFAVALGTVGVYLVIRPILEATPQFKEFYAEANTFWQKVFALAYNSGTIVWSYGLGAGGLLVNQGDNIAALLGDPDFKAQLSNLLGADSKTLGIIFMCISVITFAARMRSIVRA